MVRSFCTTTVVPSGVPVDCSDFFNYDDASENATLEALEGASALSFVSSPELAAVP